MTEVHCKRCDKIIGTSDGRVFYKDGRLVNDLTCECGAVRKLHGKRQRPAPIELREFTLRIGTV